MQNGAEARRVERQMNWAEGTKRQIGGKDWAGRPRDRYEGKTRQRSYKGIHRMGGSRMDGSLEVDSIDRA